MSEILSLLLGALWQVHFDRKSTDLLGHTAPQDNSCR